MRGFAKTDRVRTSAEQTAGLCCDPTRNQRKRSCTSLFNRRHLFSALLQYPWTYGKVYSLYHIYSLFIWQGSISDAPLSRSSCKIRKKWVFESFTPRMRPLLPRNGKEKRSASFKLCKDSSSLLETSSSFRCFLVDSLFWQKTSNPLGNEKDSIQYDAGLPKVWERKHSTAQRNRKKQSNCISVLSRSTSPAGSYIHYQLHPSICTWKSDLLHHFEKKRQPLSSIQETLL